MALTVSCLAVAMFSTLGAPGGDSTQDRPNVLILIADDLCYRDLGFQGHPDVRTPHLDRLRAEGIQLKGLFSSSATCSPTRHALYTGLYPLRSGAYPNHTRIDPSTETIFTLLKRFGYRVDLAGKKHVRPASCFPWERGSDERINLAGELSTFLQGQDDRPWFFVAASNEPHTPWNRGQTKHPYDPDQLIVPDDLYDNPETRQALACYYSEISFLDDQFGDCLSVLDDMGQTDSTLVFFLSEQGASFPWGGKWTLSDNGIHVAALARWPGRIAAGSSSPALLQYVDVAPTILQAVGIDPSEIDTGCPDAEGDRGFDGKSFLDVLIDQTATHRQFVLSQHTTKGVNGYQQLYPSRSVRDTRYKLIWNLCPENRFVIGGIHRSSQGIYQSLLIDALQDPELRTRLAKISRRPEWELYDLQRDPLELTNLATLPELATVRRRLERELRSWMSQQGDQGVASERKAHLRQGPAKRSRQPAPGPKRQR